MAATILKLTRSALLTIALIGAGGAAVAQAPSVPPTAKPLMWSQLSRPQQVALEPLLSEWDKMDAARKQKWLEIANRYSSMKPDEQQRVQERMRDWIKLTPEERRVARENYTLSKKLGKNQKSVQWEQYQALPDEEKKKLAADAASKKQVTNLPSKTQPKAVAPSKPAPAAVACPAGSVRNPAASAPPCIPAAQATPAPAQPVTPSPLTPAAPVPNVK